MGSDEEQVAVPMTRQGSSIDISSDSWCMQCRTVVCVVYTNQERFDSSHNNNKMPSRPTALKIPKKEMKE